MGKDRRSKDQRRKAKLEKRAKRLRDTEIIPYHGKKYRRTDLIPTFYQTELGIHEAFVTYDRKLTDDMVVGAIAQLIQQLRQGALPPAIDPDSIEEIEGNEEDFIVQNIRRHWEILFRDSPCPVKEDLIGILRTTLGSIEIWATGVPSSQQYLCYIESFLGFRQGGVTPQLSDDFVLSGERAGNDLLMLGKTWRDDDDQRAAIQFVNQAMSMANKGQALQVSEVCDQLVEQYGEDDRFAALLKTISREALGTELNPLRASGGEGAGLSVANNSANSNGNGVEGGAVDSKQRLSANVVAALLSSQGPY